MCIEVPFQMLTLTRLEVMPARLVLATTTAATTTFAVRTPHQISHTHNTTTK